MYCPECGVDHHAGDRQETAALDREVEIARVNAKRDIEVARINAGSVRAEVDAEVEIAEVDAVAGVEAAEAVADALTEIAAPPEPEPAPTIVVEPEPEPEPEPAPIEEVMPPPEKSGSHSYGNSHFFGGR